MNRRGINKDGDGDLRRRKMNGETAKCINASKRSLTSEPLHRDKKTRCRKITTMMNNGEIRSLPTIWGIVTKMAMEMTTKMEDGDDIV